MEKLLIDHQSISLSQWDFIIRLLVAIGIGSVIGLERQFHAMKENTQGFAGIQTFVFFVLLGFIAALFYFLFSPWAYVALSLGVSLLIATTYWFSTSKGDRGNNRAFSSFLAFVLGSMVFVGLIEISLMVTVLIVVILSSKLKGKSLELSIGAVAILIAVISNTLVKMGIGIYAGSSALRKNLLLGYGTMFLTALLAFFLL